MLFSDYVCVTKQLRRGTLILWIKLILCMLVDIGLKFYAVPSWSTLGDLEVKVTDLQNFMLKFFIKDLRSLYLLNMLMDQVDTLHV